MQTFGIISWNNQNLVHCLRSLYQICLNKNFLKDSIRTIIFVALYGTGFFALTNINIFHPFFVVTVPRNRIGITDILHQVICLYIKGQTPLQYAVLGQEHQKNGKERLQGKFS